jgi:hypothetical protein
MAVLAVLNEGCGPMKQSKFSEERVIYPFGTPSRAPASDCDRQLSSSVYAWKKKHAHFGEERAASLPTLEEEQRLTRKRSMACELFAGQF